MCLEYRKKIDDLSEALSIQKEINTKLEEARAQSELFAQQTKDYSDIINKELAELTSKHVSCQENNDLVEQKSKAISALEKEVSEVKGHLETCFDERNQLEKELTHVKEQLNKAKEQNTTIFNENRQLSESKKEIEAKLNQKTKQFETLNMEKA